MPRDNYSEILARIQETFDVDEVTPQNIADYLNSDSRGRTLGRRRLATALSRVIQKERQISISFAQVQNFAIAKGIKLSEKIVGKIEKWKGKEVLVIRKNGKFKAWKRL